MTKCKRNGCDNEARYVDSVGNYACGVCDAQSPFASVKINDVPALLRLVEQIIVQEQQHRPRLVEKLRELVSAKTVQPMEREFNVDPH